MSAEYNWTINQGETSALTYKRTLTSDGSAINFASGATFRMQAKDRHGGSTTVVNLTNSAFTHTSASNEFTVSIPAATTEAIAAPGRYVYDIEAVEGTTVTRVLEGALIVRPEVTTSS